MITFKKTEFINLEIARKKRSQFIISLSVQI